MLNRFWPLQGWGGGRRGLGKSVKKEKHQEIKGCILSLFIRHMYLENLKYNLKHAFIFHLILLDIPSSLILSVKKQTKSVKHDKMYLWTIPK